MKDKVKEFWVNQAEEHKESDIATAPDHYYRLLEIDRIKSYLVDGKKVLDVGCGNGYSTIEFAKAFPRSRFVGVDYCEDFIKYAKSALAKENADMQKRIEFVVGDARDLSSALGKKQFDFIISERCIINLKDWKEQQIALLEFDTHLSAKGKIILAENTQEGLANLNELRVQFGLKMIEVRWHNFYIPQKKFMEFTKKHYKVVSVKNIGNLYYILSRVVYATLAHKEGKEPEYKNPINEIASKLPSLDNCHYSPNYIFLLGKK